MQLADIADRHACDKGRRGPSSRWIATNYADVYQAYLHHRRDEPLSLLEIGLGVKGPNWRADVVHGRNTTGGASLKMWSDYLPNARITGLDINPAKFLDTDRITTYQVDQGSPGELRKFLAEHPDPSFDIVIDDGSHRPDHQQVTLEALFPHVKPDGLYFIEDLSEFGYGGPKGSRHGSADFVSTRELFKRYERTGEIAEPNAFRSTEFFSDISDIMFYSPRPLQRPGDLLREAVRTFIGRSRAGISRYEWAPDSELVVALRKKG